MEKKYKGKYRVKSVRLQNWDYGSNGIYFVTICTKNRKHFFGEVSEGKMVLSQTGKIATQFWNAIKDHFPFVILDEFIVMPDHIHGIIILNKSKKDIKLSGDVTCNVCTDDMDSKNKGMAEISPKPGSLSTIIRSYKSAVTRDARAINIHFGWQSKFHESIVRDEASLKRIKNYIFNNPKNWSKAAS